MLELQVSGTAPGSNQPLALHRTTSGQGLFSQHSLMLSCMMLQQVPERVQVEPPSFANYRERFKPLQVLGQKQEDASLVPTGLTLSCMQPM